MGLNKPDLRIFIYCLISFFIALFVSYSITMKKSEKENDLIINTDEEIVLIYFGCSTCNAAMDKRIPRMLEILSNKLNTEAINKGYRFTFIGTSSEINVRAGYKYLGEIAEFDEISVGNEMRNVTIQRYIWERFDSPLSASTPQVIITKRKYYAEKFGEREITSSEISAEEILVRIIGVDNIFAFTQNTELIIEK